jgi:glucose/arabinose dehydrogenase
MVGQNPKAPQLQAAMEAHLAEHIAFEYRRQIEQQLGVPLPKEGETLPEDIENQVARLSAEAGAKLLQLHQAEAAQKQAQQQAEDPLIQMQKQELQIKQMETQAKTQKMQADTQLDVAKLELEKQKLEVNTQRDVMLEQARITSNETIKGAELGAKAVTDDRDVKAKELLEGAKMGVEVVKANADIALRQQESQLKNETAAHEQKLKDRAQIEETKLEDETKLNEKE